MILQLVYLVLIVIIGLQFPKLILDRDEEYHRKPLRYLLFFHFLMGFAYFLYTRNGGGDAWGYWEGAQYMSSSDFSTYFNNSTGTRFMYALNYIPANILGMSYFTNTMLYSLIGYMGLTFFYILAIRLVPYNSEFKGYKLFPLIFFLPNLHFWSSGVGKDTISFFCIGMFVYGILKPFKRMPLLIISLLLAYFIRPHIVFFLVMAFGLAYLTGRHISAFRRVIFSVAFIGIGLAILPSVLKFVKVDDASLESFEQFATGKSGLLNGAHTTSSVDISSYPFPLKVFTFLYRPLFFDINGIPAIIASLENLFLLILTYRIFKSRPWAAFKSAPFVIKGMVFFFLIGTFAFSQALGNMGIMLRMRNMFLPGFLIYMLWTFSYQHENYLAFKQNE